MKIRAFWMAIVSIVFVGQGVGAATIGLNAIRDNTLYYDLSGDLSNGAGDYFFVGNNNASQPRRGLIAFDISGNIPTGATITEVILGLTMSRAQTGEQPISLHTVSQNWGEGASNAGGNEGMGTTAAAGDATWLHTFSDGFGAGITSWTTAGGDFNAAASATTAVGALGPYSWNSGGMIADVQAWLDTPSSNFGWLLLGNESALGTAKRFDSKDILGATQPLLSVAYTPSAVPIPAALPLFASALMGFGLMGYRRRKARTG